MASALASLPFDTISTSDMDFLRARVCRTSLRQFIKTFWNVVEPSTPLLWNWHLDVICDLLEQVTRGEIKRLIINVPPGTGKSLTVSVFHPAWEWASNPGLRHLLASYSSDNTIRDNRRLRDIVNCELYRRLFWNDDDIRLTSDQYAKVRFDTSSKGYSIATSIEGRGTGEHPDRIRVDDPHKLIEASSLVKRDTVGTWMKGTVLTRVSRDPIVIVIMQRVDPDDVCARLLSTGMWVHLLLPMRYEVFDNSIVDIDSTIDEDTGSKIGSWDCPCHASGSDPRDIRTKPGELLFPALFDEKKVQRIESGIDVFEFSGQYQQRPVPISGGLFKRIWFTIVEVLPAGRIVWGRGWDTAATDEAGAYSVGTKMGRIISGLERGKFVIDLDAEVREQVEDVDPWILSTAKLDGKHTRIREEQTPALGKTIIASHVKMLAGYDYAGVPSTRDKVSRSKPWRVQCKAGNVILFATDVRKAQDWLTEVCGFPLHKYKDRVDSASTIFNSLTLEDRKKRPRVIGGSRLRKAVSQLQRIRR